MLMFEVTVAVDELAIWIARRVIELEDLPHGLSDEPVVLKPLADMLLFQFLGTFLRYHELEPSKRILSQPASGQHVALHDPNPQPDCIGYIHTKMSPADVARNGSEDARCICLREYVPTHLHLMDFELVKNSLRAVQERYMDSDKVLPPVRIIVVDGIEDVTIKVFVKRF
ncbi:hypothetical protein GIB67_024474 [Kingdonia uniflora]|uniref:Protein-serine/threonine kinase n=1 Tax=Kingdonia uniflora TaxID=39325 RepID=A0A7J7MQM8_9MAGN|nr:hypothetical protein GIB67_024474 [Kingdonia uniflora]